MYFPKVLLSNRYVFKRHIFFWTNGRVLLLWAPFACWRAEADTVSSVFWYLAFVDGWSSFNENNHANKYLTHRPLTSTVVDSRWDLILLPYRLMFLLLLFPWMGPFCHLIEAHGLGCETAHEGIKRQVAEFPQPFTVQRSIRMHRFLTFYNLWVSGLI